MASIFPLFVPAIRDYIDVLNNAYDSLSTNITFQQIVQQSLVYLLTSIKFIFIYFFSFQWIQDLTYLPIIVPQLKVEILKEHFFLQTPQSNFFTFLEIPSYTNNKFLLGLANSFFLCLPLSVAHIISIRRLLIQGVVAGVFSSLGTVCGQILLIIFILFGGRFFIIPWFNFQVINYCVGIWIALRIVHDMIHERSIRIIDSSNTYTLFKIFMLNFILAWTEQSCIFQYFGNLTLGAEPSPIEIFSCLGAFQSFLTHVTYVFGISLGSILFTSLFIVITLKISNLCVQLLSILYSRWIRRLNYVLIRLIIIFTFTSIPFYSFDYLVLSNLGFVSQDKSLQNTIFSGRKVYDIKHPLLGNVTNAYADNKPRIDTDIAPFGKGRYLIFDVNDSFEEMNYQGEYAWLVSKHRHPPVLGSIASSRSIKITKRLFNTTKKTFFQKNLPKKTSRSQINNEINFSNNTIDPNSFESDENEDLINTFTFRNKKQYFINNCFEKLINLTCSQNFFTNEEIEKSILKKSFQQKYYCNPIYKLLLSADIDLFLSRQPRSFRLSPKQEHDLFKKRIILSNYYDSLRYYSELPYADEFQNIFNGSKSYADRVYNHQFNGTLKIVRRLFSINGKLNDFPNIPAANSLSLITPSKNVLTAEQPKPASLKAAVSKTNVQKKFLEKNKPNADSFTLKFDQPLYKKVNSKSSLFSHEEFNANQKINNSFNASSLPLESLEKVFDTSLINQPNQQLEKNLPFIQLTNPIPFYVGWDEQLRKLVITNRLSPRYLAGESMKFVNKSYTNNYSTLNKLIKQNKAISFTTWPIPEENLKQPNDISYNLLFDLLTEKNFDKLQDLVSRHATLVSFFNPNALSTEKLTSIPSKILVNTNKVEKKKKRNLAAQDNQLQHISPCTRGGVLWPGHSDLKFTFKNLIPSYLKNKK